MRTYIHTYTHKRIHTYAHTCIHKRTQCYYLCIIRFFGGDKSLVPTQAVTVGVGTVMDAKEVRSHHSHMPNIHLYALQPPAGDDTDNRSAQGICSLQGD